MVKIKKDHRYFSGSPVVKTELPLQRAQVQPLIGELTSSMPCGTAKKTAKSLACNKS